MMMTLVSHAEFISASAFTLQMWIASSLALLPMTVFWKKKSLKEEKKPFSKRWRFLFFNSF